MAQGYQEYQLDQAVQCSGGTIGVTQVMPTTGKQMGAGARLGLAVFPSKA